MRSFSHRCASRSMSITLGVSSTVRCHTTAFVHAAVSKGLGLISLWHLKVCVPRCMHYASIFIAFPFIFTAFSSIFVDFSSISMLFHRFSLLFHRIPLRAAAAIQAAVRGLVFGRFCAVKAIDTSANFGPAKSHRASRVFLRRFRVYNPIAGPQGPPLSVILLHGFLPFVFI